MENMNDNSTTEEQLIQLLLANEGLNIKDLLKNVEKKVKLKQKAEQDLKAEKEREAERQLKVEVLNTKIKSVYDVLKLNEEQLILLLNEKEELTGKKRRKVVSGFKNSYTPSLDIIASEYGLSKDTLNSWKNSGKITWDPNCIINLKEFDTFLKDKHKDNLNNPVPEGTNVRRIKWDTVNLNALDSLLLIQQELVSKRNLNVVSNGNDNVNIDYSVNESENELEVA